MKKLAMQPQRLNGQLVLVPMCEEDKLAGYKINQPLVVTVKGSRKERSLVQLGTYWACCRVVSEQHRQFADDKEVDDQLRVNLEFYDKNRCRVDAAGNTHIFYRSIAVDNLEHVEACQYFDRAFDLMAEWLGITREMLIANCTKKQV